MIREKAEKIVTEEQQEKVLKITAESEQERVERWKKEAVPMPEDCRVALAKIGIKLQEIA